MKRLTFLTAILLTFLLAFAGVALADHDKGKGKSQDDKDDDDEQGERPAAVVFQAHLFRVAELQVGLGFGTVGTDPLRRGSVRILQTGRVLLAVDGASPSQSYLVWLCHMTTGPNCHALGTFNTNAGGDGAFEAMLPAALLKLAGQVVLARGSVFQFISGFARPAPPVDPGVEVELKGTLSIVNLGNMTVRLETFPVDIQVNSNTRLDGVRSFSDLRVGMDVEVRGFASAAGIVATRLKVD